jgi:hypothetical protein
VGEQALKREACLERKIGINPFLDEHVGVPGAKR